MNLSDLNKQKVRQFFDEVLNEGRLELIDELVAKDFIGHLSCGAVHGPAGVRQFVSGRRTACPSLYLKVDDQIAEEDRVVTRWRATGLAPSATASAAAIDPESGLAGITIIRLLAGMQVDSYTQCAGARWSSPGTLTVG